MITVTKPESPAEFNPFRVTRDLRARAPTGVRSSDWADRNHIIHHTFRVPVFRTLKVHKRAKNNFERGSDS